MSHHARHRAKAAAVEALDSLDRMKKEIVFILAEEPLDGTMLTRVIEDILAIQSLRNRIRSYYEAPTE